MYSKQFIPLVIYHWNFENPGWFLYQNLSKKTMEKPGHLGPISLTQFLFKTMERVVEWSLRENSDNYGKISDMQHAYSSTKGTDTALTTLVNLIESCILRNQISLVLSVFIISAFDNLATQTIHDVLLDNNYPPIMIMWYMNFKKNRNSIAEVLGIIKSIRPVCGTPQGGVLSSRNWKLHVKTKVSKAITFLAMIKPAINFIYGLSPARMLWIYKQILLPRITYGSHVWGHSLREAAQKKAV